MRLILPYSPEAPAGAGFACGRVPFRLCEKEPKAHLGRKRGRLRTPRARSALQRFPLRTPRRGHFCGNARTADAARLPGKPVFPETLSALRGGRGSSCVYYRRGITGHTKPLFPAGAPLAIVKIRRAIVQRLRWRFACGCGALSSAFPTSQHQPSASGNRRTASYRRSRKNFCGAAKAKLCQTPSRGTQGIIPCALLW